PKDGMMRVITRIQFQEAPELQEIDWESELKTFQSIEYPQYYCQPFHSVLGGWLSEAAAVRNRTAMEAVLENAHPQKSLGVREEIAQLFPENARRILDFGAGIGDDGAAIARRLPNAKVTAWEASPFMIIVGRLLHKNLPNLDWQHGLVENTRLPDNSVDAINMTYVLHECPDEIKQVILQECLRILSPGGVIVVTDSLPGDLHSYRGFFEPYKEQWLKINPDQLLKEAGFIEIKAYQFAYPTWTRVGQKPNSI
ncbi:MAG TPA: methyltransferase type 11, partial [Cyanothece sp. UBA12306]|nr:methyltransferase type 11 [Cyanothece sp. UBA12306]